MKPVFISGPHGSGKTTLIGKLMHKYPDLFIENDFDIDFFIHLPSYGHMNNFERCLLKLYHRYIQYIYITKHSCNEPDKTTLVSRSIYDIISYIETYNKLDIILPDEFNLLSSIYNSIDILPSVIILNPDVDIIKHRLDNRRSTGERKKRDKVFAFEDKLEFLEIMHGIFEKMQTLENVKYIVDNDDVSVNDVLNWIESIN